MIHKQGKTYDEVPVDEEVLAEKKGLNKKTFILIGAVVLAVVAIAIVMILVRGGGGGGDSDIDTPTSSGDFVDVGSEDDIWADIPTVTFSYTAEEKSSLRAWGYTGDEIESYEALETSVDTLIEASRQAQEEARATLSNPESPEYQALLNSTFLGQNRIMIPADIDPGAIYYNTVTLNADYEKVEAHGHNLYLKVYLDDGSYSFMECPLNRYSTLAESGNIVVTYRTATYEGVEIIYDMTEVQVG